MLPQVTHNPENVVDLQWLDGGEMPPEDLDGLSRNLAFHLKQLVDERDTQLEVAYSEQCVSVDAAPSSNVAVDWSSDQWWKMLPLPDVPSGKFPLRWCHRKRAAAGRKA